MSDERTAGAGLLTDDGSYKHKFSDSKVYAGEAEGCVLVDEPHDYLSVEPLGDDGTPRYAGVNDELNAKCDDAETNEFAEYFVEYPSMLPEHFKDSFMLSVGPEVTDQGSIKSVIDGTTLSYERTGEILLKDATVPVPTYDVSFETKDGQEITLNDRVAIAGIGSNSSSDVLARKFAEIETDPQDPKDQFLAVMQASIEDHSVVKAAMTSGRGSVPVTIFPSEGNSTAVTVGFYTKAQAERLTGTEPNYDGVMIDAPIALKTGAKDENGNVVDMEISNVVIYSCIWGALKGPDGRPIADSQIPQDNDLISMNTPQTLLYATSLTNPEMNTLQYAFSHASSAPGITPEIKEDRTINRAEQTKELFEKHSMSDNKIQGVIVFPSTIATKEHFKSFAPTLEERMAEHGYPANDNSADSVGGFDASAQSSGVGGALPLSAGR